MKHLSVDDAYMVSRQGKVYSTLFGKLKELKTSLDISGKYERVTLRSNKAYLVHRLVALTYIPNPDNLPQVNHIDGDMKNNNVENLEWVSISGNQLHAYETGLKTKPKGLLNGRQELSEEDVLEIYNKALIGYTNKSLSTSYNVSTTQIGRIKNKCAWSHITQHLSDIEIRKKAKPLDLQQVEILEGLIVSGYTMTLATLKAPFVFTSDQFYSIKSNIG
jgi:hypothetical protein